LIRLAFYIANKTIWDRVISGWTWIWTRDSIKTSHVEIGFLIYGNWKYFSSCSRYYDSSNKKSNGTRWIKANELFKHPENWYVVEMKPLRAEKDMITHATLLAGNRYDWWGVMGFATLFGLINDPDDWYCSEVCWQLLIGDWLKRISPRRMYKRCKKVFDMKEVDIRKD